MGARCSLFDCLTVCARTVKTGEVVGHGQSSAFCHATVDGYEEYVGTMRMEPGFICSVAE